MQLLTYHLDELLLDAAVIDSQLLGKDGDISTFRLLHNAAATFIQDCNSVNRSELSHFLCELYAGNFTTVFSAQQIMGF